MKENTLPTTADKGEIVLYQPNETIRLEVRMENETVWLSQAQMAELFGRERSVIGKHIKNIFQEGELVEQNTCAKFAHMGNDGLQLYETINYNLDVIISVGYRVKSLQGTLFRQWATQVLKEYLLRGFSIRQELQTFKNEVNTHFRNHEMQLIAHQQKIDFFVRTSLPPVEGIFFENQIFDAYVFVSKLIKSTKESIVLIDNYIDESVLTLLDKRNENIPAVIFIQRISPQLQLDIAKHNAQYQPIEVKIYKNAHDRFLVIDNDLYHIGASIKDLGKKLFAFSKITEFTKMELLERL